ncbi:MAG TPA: hypothetical protein VIF62_02750 [Labilithrix sp.]
MRRLVFLVFLAACSRKQDGPAAPAAPSASVAAATDDPPLSADVKRCGATCTKWSSPEDAFKWVLALDPSILAVGEAHAQRGTEEIASSTKRFTDSFLPLLAGRASDVVVELWAPDPKCQREVKQVASAQKPVTSAQAATNPNEYVTLGTHAKELGITPWLLRPTCDDFAMLADAGADAVGPMLSLVKRLTEQKIAQLRERADGGSSIVVTYGGAMHNDIEPSAETKEWAFGPDMVRAVGRRYVELDLIVPEYVKDTPTWQSLPWYAAWKADSGPKDETTMIRTGDRSFVIVFPQSAVR